MILSKCECQAYLIEAVSLLNQYVYIIIDFVLFCISKCHSRTAFQLYWLFFTFNFYVFSAFFFNSICISKMYWFVATIESDKVRFLIKTWKIFPTLCSTVIICWKRLLYGNYSFADYQRIMLLLVYITQIWLHFWIISDTNYFLK